MAAGSDKDFAIAKVYAGAMLQLAEARKESDRLLEELAGLSDHMEKDRDFEAFLTSPMVDTKKREKSLEKVFRGKLSDLCVDSLQIINRKERLALFGQIVEAFRLALEDIRGIVEVQVRTAHELSAELKSQGERFAAKLTGKKVVLVPRVDDSLIGGLVVQVGDKKYDMSVATQLRVLGEALHERSSREIHRGAIYVQ